MTHSSCRIESVTARSVLDSRGRPTVEVDVLLESGLVGRACAPSGASTGRHEAVELRDGDAEVFDGFGVSKAVQNVTSEIAPLLQGADVREQSILDAKMVSLDGTANFARLGANATLATSLAICRAASAASKLPLHRYINTLIQDRPMTLPMPMTNILSGGAHAGRGMDIQDFLAVPLSARNYTQALQMVAKVRTAASALSGKMGLPVLLADEGGLSPGFSRTDQAMELMIDSIKEAGYKPGADVAIALDVAASELYTDKSYELRREGKSLSSDAMAAFIADLARRYPIYSIEDALDQDDWEHWHRLTATLTNCQLLGDDLFVTNRDRIRRGISEGVGNAVLIKVNQNGTLTGTLEAMRTAWDAGYATIVSARSGETDDSFISDLAVGTGAGQIKIGSTRNSERLSKYNQLLRIEETDDLPFAGATALAGIASRIAEPASPKVR